MWFQFILSMKRCVGRGLWSVTAKCVSWTSPVRKQNLRLLVQRRRGLECHCRMSSSWQREPRRLLPLCSNGSDCWNRRVLRLGWEKPFIS